MRRRQILDLHSHKTRNTWRQKEGTPGETRKDSSLEPWKRHGDNS
jgi:hypothetical protein